ncbi:hypothetical protein IQ277_35400 [Nostocales cyanobacterium LEGE 12452]|nr:hypothetical protein [Nostocales cyanobacterium LEGE 12452]
MRSEKDNCLLCEQNPACKRESHIIPHSMVKRLRKPRGKVWKVDASRRDKRALIEQDVSKERYILCDDCETYIGFLETHFGQTIKKFVEQNRIGVDFAPLQQIQETGGNITKIQTAYVCFKAQPLMTQLLIDSILFRIHIASKSTFAYTTFPTEILKKLKINLLTFKSKTYNEVLDKCKEYNGNNVFFTPYLLYCPKTEIVTSKAIVYEFIEPTPDFLKILVGEYWIWIPSRPIQSPFLNSGETPVKVLRLTVQQYEKMYKEMFELYARIDAYNDSVRD